MKKHLIYLCFILFANAALSDASVSIKAKELVDIAIYPKRHAPATVISLNESIISSRIDTQVDEISVKVGDIVKKDDVLVRLNCSDYLLSTIETKAYLEKTNSQINLAKLNLKRTETLVAKNSISQEVLDNRKAELDILKSENFIAKAKHEKSKINKLRCIIKSPFYGLVTERFSSIGEFANVGTKLIKLIDIENLEVTAQIFNQDAKHIKNAKQLFFKHNEDKYQIKLRTISKSIDYETRNREVRLLFIDKSALHGTSGKLVWKDSRAHIPGKYLVRRKGVLGIFTIEEGKAKFIPIPNAQAGRATPVSFPDETLIITEGQYSLKDKDNVNL